MGLFKDTPNDFVQHEIKTFQRKGDQVRSEYERLNPDGSVTKTVAFGDCKEGLKYRTFNMGVDGVVRELTAEQASPTPRPVAQQPPQPPQQPLRRTYTFNTEPRPRDTQESGTWHVRPQGLQEREREKATPWWYNSLKEAITGEVKEEKPREKPEPIPEKKAVRQIFDFFSDDMAWYHLKPKTLLKPRPRFTDPFDLLEDSFDRPLFGNFFSTPLLEDF